MDWACLVLVALEVVLVHLVLASAAREQNISSNVEVGLGSERVGKCCAFIGFHNKIQSPSFYAKDATQNINFSGKC